VREILYNLIQDRKEKVPKEVDGTVTDKDQQEDLNEESKDDNHILEVKKREADMPPRMQTRLSQQHI